MNYFYNRRPEVTSIGGVAQVSTREDAQFEYNPAMAELRDCAENDLDSVLSLNEAAVPAMNSLTVDEMRWFIEHAAYFRVAETGGEVAAFLIGLREGLDYASLNYRWFTQRFETFAYIDRVAVHARARRHGLASRLYDDFAARCASDSGKLVCEVNLRPANDGSVRFHEGYGFRQVGTQETENGSKLVSLMLKELDNRNE